MSKNLPIKKIEIYAPSAYDMDIDALLGLVRQWLEVARKFEDMGPAGIKAVQDYMKRLRVVS